MKFNVILESINSKPQINNSILNLYKQWCDEHDLYVDEYKSIEEFSNDIQNFITSVISMRG